MGLFQNYSKLKQGVSNHTIYCFQQQEQPPPYTHTYIQETPREHHGGRANCTSSLTPHTTSPSKIRLRAGTWGSWPPLHMVADCILKQTSLKSTLNYNRKEFEHSKEVQQDQSLIGIWTYSFKEKKLPVHVWMFPMFKMMLFLQGKTSRQRTTAKTVLPHMLSVHTCYIFK